MAAKRWSQAKKRADNVGGTMAVQDHPKFKEWEVAVAELETRKAHYEAAAKSFSKTHPLYKHCMQKLADAQAAYDKVVSEL